MPHAGWADLGSQWEAAGGCDRLRRHAQALAGQVERRHQVAPRDRVGRRHVSADLSLRRATLGEHERFRACFLPLQRIQGVLMIRLREGSDFFGVLTFCACLLGRHSLTPYLQGRSVSALA